MSREKVLRYKEKGGAFRAQKAVEKLKNENRPDLAAYTLAMDSEREMNRSELVPMAPSYQKVTDYLRKSHAKQTKQAK